MAVNASWGTSWLTSWLTSWTREIIVPPNPDRIVNVAREVRSRTVNKPETRLFEVIRVTRDSTKVHSEVRTIEVT